MIIKKEVRILDGTQYQLYSDKKFYIRNTTNGTLWSVVNTIADEEYEETDIPIIDDNEKELKLRQLVADGFITSDEFKAITDKDY